MMQFKCALGNWSWVLRLAWGSWLGVSQHQQLPHCSAFQVSAAESARPAVTCSALLLLTPICGSQGSTALQRVLSCSLFYFYVHFFFLKINSPSWLSKCVQHLKARFIKWDGYNKMKENSIGKNPVYHSPQNREKLFILRADEFMKPNSLYIVHNSWCF